MRSVMVSMEYVLWWREVEPWLTECYRDMVCKTQIVRYVLQNWHKILSSPGHKFHSNSWPSKREVGVQYFWGKTSLPVCSDPVKGNQKPSMFTIKRKKISLNYIFIYTIKKFNKIFCLSWVLLEHHKIQKFCIFYNVNIFITIKFWTMPSHSQILQM